jgi:hypothetical protein
MYTCIILAALVQMVSAGMRVEDGKGITYTILSPGGRDITR